ncbi:MAG: sigma-70 family RNA polymerase sigma factor, partial [Pseudomonadota bacterium]
MAKLSKIRTREPLGLPSASDGVPEHEATVTANEAFTRFYLRFAEKLKAGLESTYGSGPPDPEEVAHQTFLKLSERVDFHGIKDLEAFTWVIAHNRMRSELRAMRVREKHADPINFGPSCDEFDPERVLGGKQEVEVVERVLQDMSERRRGIFIANRIDGLTPEQAGARFGVSRTAAMRHIANATA